MSASSPRIGALDIAKALGRPAPTAEQVAVIEAPPGALLVVAGAGSGKTETMTGRVVWIVANGLVAADEVLGLTFTRKAAGELSERITTRLIALRTSGLWTPEDDLPAYPSVQTYHAYAGELVREHALRVGREPDARLLTEAACWQFASAVVEAYEGDLTDVDKAVSTMTEAVVALAAELGEHLLTPADLEQWIDGFLAELDRPREPGRLRAHPAAELVGALRARRAVLPMVTAYQARKQAAQAMDFADVMALAARIAIEHPDVGVRERRRYRAVLLDEFQDSSDAQLALLAALYGPAAPGVETGMSVTAVGDPNQSIYGWRGASSSTLIRMPSAFGADLGGAARTLRTSWRNDRRILDVANVLAAPLRSGQPAALPACELAARPGAGDGLVSIARVTTLEEEADLIASVLRARWLPADGDAGDDRPTAAVLCRRRSQFDIIAKVLREHGLPVEIVGLGGLLLAPEIVELVALLTVVHDPSRGDQLMRLLTGAVCRLGVADIDVLSAWARRLSREDGAHVDEVALADAIDRLPPPDWVAPGGLQLSAVGRRRVEQLAAMVAHVRRLGATTLPETVAAAERVLGLDVELTARAGMDPGVARAHLDAFAEVVDDFTAAADRPGLGAFLSWLDAARERERGLDAPETEPNAGAVQVMTIHAAKGLEWDLVAIPGLVEFTLPAGTQGKIGDAGEAIYLEPSGKGWTKGLSGVPYPLRRDAPGLPTFEVARAKDWPALRDEVAAFSRRVGAHELAEERRLAYVAVTRARHEVLLTAAIWGEGSKPRVHSRFLEEIREAFAPGAGPWTLEVIRWADLPAKEVVNPRLTSAAAATWPSAHDQNVRAQLADRAAQQVRAAIAAPPPRATGTESEGVGTGWLDLAQRLLAERRRAQRPDPAPHVTHLSASGLVDLAADPAAFAARVRRPMPAPPAPAARRGTAFHAWVEEHFRSAAIVDVEELPGSADHDTGLDADLEEMKTLFLASEWAGRVPLEVESAIETVIGGVSVRARIDAVFPDDAAGKGGHAGPGRVVVVDWKTGLRPSPAEAARRALQLGVYAHAYRELTGASVRAAFYYARSGETQWVPLPDGAQIQSVLEQSLAQWD